MEKIYPFKFLDAYTTRDQDIFFGRDEEIETLYELIFQTNLVLVYGPSGTGKTSLIQCGLAKKLKSHDWLPLFIRRGNDLNAAFDRALEEAGGTLATDSKRMALLEALEAGPDAEGTVTQPQSILARRFKAAYLKHFKPIYLIFDQFEELYILGNREEQMKFIGTVQEILSVEQPVKIIISIREEYLGFLSDFEKAVPELQRKKLRVEPMGLEKVKAVIRGACTVDHGLVLLPKGDKGEFAEQVFEKIRGADKSQTIQLPYLQVFLDRLYLKITHDEERKLYCTYNYEGLREIGDLGDVLRDLLEEQVLLVAQSLMETPDRIWRILTPLVTLEGTKQPITLAALQAQVDIIPPKTIELALKQFQRGGILRYTDNEQLYEVAHDALARKIVAKRTDEEIGILRVKQLLKTQLAQQESTLDYFTEKQLLFIDLYIDKFEPSAEERDWVVRSRARLQAMQAAEARRVHAEVRRARVMFGLAVIAAIVTFTLMAVAMKQCSRAKKAEELALSRTYESRMQFLNNYTESLAFKSHAALVDGDRNTAFRLAEFAYRYANGENPLVLQAFLEAYYTVDGIEDALPLRVENLVGHSGAVKAAAFSPNGKYLSSVGSGELMIWDLAKGKVIRSRNVHIETNCLAISPNGRQLAVAGGDSLVTVWNFGLDSSYVLPKIDQGGKIRDLSFSPDGKRIAAVCSESKVSVWDVMDRKVIFSRASNDSEKLAYSPDGKYLAIGSWDDPIELLNPSDGKLLRKIEAESLTNQCLAFSPDSRNIATVNDNKEVVIFDTETGKLQNTLKGAGYITDIEFSPVGRVLLAAGEKGVVAWLLDFGGEGAQLTGHTSLINQVRWEPTAKSIATASDDGLIKIWNIDTNEESNFVSRMESSESFAISRGGDSIATNSYQYLVELVDLKTGTTIQHFGDDLESYRSICFGRNDQLLATGSVDSIVRIWNVTTGKLIMQLPRHAGEITPVLNVLRLCSKVANTSNAGRF